MLQLLFVVFLPLHLLLMNEENLAMTQLWRHLLLKPCCSWYSWYLKLIQNKFWIQAWILLFLNNTPLLHFHYYNSGASVKPEDQIEQQGDEIPVSFDTFDILDFFTTHFQLHTLREPAPYHRANISAGTAGGNTGWHGKFRMFHHLSNKSEMSRELFKRFVSCCVRHHIICSLIWPHMSQLHK